MLASRGMYILTSSEKLDVFREFCDSFLRVRPTVKDLTSLLVFDHVNGFEGKEVIWNAKDYSEISLLWKWHLSNFQPSSTSNLFDTDTKLLICSELTIIVNLGHRVPELVGNGHICLKRRIQAYGHTTRTWKC